MFQVNITRQAEKCIHEYVYLYERYFLSLFHDTGIWSEEQIRENYRNTAKELFHRMYDLIQDKCSQEVLPYAEGQNSIRSTTLSLGNRRIAIEYTESPGTRIIQDLNIWYKH